MFNFLHNFEPQPILFHWYFINIHWYGVFIVCAILVALRVASNLGKKINIKSEEIFDLAFYAIFFGLIGARFYAVFLDWEYYLEFPAKIIAVWEGGLAIHGAIIGGVLAAAIYCLKNKKPFWVLADLAAVGLPLAQAIGRWGNYFNQEVFGKPTDLPWGIPINFANRPLQYLSDRYFHPTFLYESILDLSNFILLYFIFRKIYSMGNEGLFFKIGEYKISLKPGFIFFVYLLNYGLIRLLMEFLRVDQTLMLGQVRLPILVSLGLIFGSIFLLIYFKIVRK